MIISVPGPGGKTAQIDMAQYTTAHGDWIRKNGTGPFQLKTIGGQVATVDPAMWTDRHAGWVMKNVSKDHYHPRDVEAPLFKGGFSERVHELFNPGERAKGTVGTLAKTPARTGLGMIEAVAKTLKLGGHLVSNIFPAEMEAREQSRIIKDLAEMDEWYGKRFKELGGRDIYSGIGAFIPDAILIALSMGTSGPLVTALSKSGQKAMAKQTAKMVARGIEDKAVKKWVVENLAERATLGQIEKTAGQAVLKEIPEAVAKKTMFAQKAAGAAEMAAKEFGAGTVYGTIKSGGDLKEALKEGLTFAAFTPFGIGSKMLKLRKAQRGGLPGLTAWTDTKLAPSAGKTVRDWVKTGAIDEEQALGWYLTWRAGPRKAGATLEDYMANTIWKSGEYQGPQTAGLTEAMTARGHRPIVDRTAELGETAVREGESLRPVVEPGMTGIKGAVPETTIPATFRDAPGLSRAEMAEFEGTMGGMMPELFQGKVPRGSTKFMDDGTSVVTLFREADFSTFVHEAAHIWRRNLPEKLLQKIEKELNVVDGQWTREAEEAFALRFETYIGNGVAEPGLKLPFEHYANWMKKVYGSSRGTPIDDVINPELQDIFTEMLARKPGGVVKGVRAAADTAKAGEAGEGAFPGRVSEEGLLQPAKELFQDGGQRRSYSPPEPFGVKLEKAATAAKQTGQALKPWLVQPVGKTKEVWPQIAEFVGHKLFDDLQVIKKYSADAYDAAVRNLGAKGKAFRMGANNLKWAFRPIEGMEETVKWRGIDAYVPEIVSDVAAARRAMELAKQRRNPGKFYTSGEAGGILRDFEKMRGTELGAAVDRSIENMYKVNDRLLKYWVEKDVLSEEIYQKIKNSNEFYMPFHRVFNKEEIKRLKAEGKHVQANSLKKLKGSDRQINDVIENMAANYMTMIPAADRHALVAQIVDAIPETMKKNTQLVKSPLAFKVGRGVDEDGVLKEFKEFFVPKIKANPNEVSFMRNGVWESWELADNYLIDAINKTYHPGAVVKILSKFKNVKTAGVTLNPVFMTRNAVRDFTTRIMNDGSIVRNPAEAGWAATAGDAAMFMPRVVKKMFYEFPLASMEVIAGTTKNEKLKQAIQKTYDFTGKEYKAGEMYQALELGGAMGSEFHAMKPGDMRKLIMESAGIDTPMIEALTDVKTLGKPIEYMTNLSRLIEQTPRMEAAQRMFEKTGDINKAVREFRRITADFALRGTVSKGTAGQISPFFSAQFAGMKSEWDAIKKNPVGWAIKATELLAVPTIALWIKNQDEDWYRKMDNSRKNMYWWLAPNIRIPKGYGLAAMSANVIERGLDRNFTDNEELVEGLREALKLSAPGLPSPPLFNAILASKTGRDPFFNSMIEPMFSEGVPKYLREKPSTSETAKYLAQPFKGEKGLSPAQIDYLVSEFGGGLGRLGVKGIDALAGRGKGQVKAAVGPEAIPGIQAFFDKDARTSTNSGEISRFYKHFNRAKMSEGEAVKLDEQQKFEALQKMLAGKRGAQARIYDSMKPYYRKIKELNDIYKEIKKPGTVEFQGEKLTPEMKRELLDMIAVQMNVVAKAGNEKYNQRR